MDKKDKTFTAIAVNNTANAVKGVLMDLWFR